ncbi:MAG: hypothetical protein HWE24_15550 [Oceanospirillaceae bacterium]|nr:hypothetical protein [Oceanospirillaceae bacterium]
MTIDPDKLAHRNIKLDQSRYGISLVAFFKEDYGFLDYKNRISEFVESEIPGCVRWIDNNKLHSTIIRGRSSPKRFDTASTCFKSVTNLLSHISAFDIKCSIPILHSDGVLRIEISDQRLLGSMTNAIRDEMERCCNLRIETQNSHWVALGTIKYINLEQANNFKIKSSDLFQDNFQAKYSSKVSDLKIVYYEDVEFKKYSVLEKIELKRNVCAR